MRYWIIGLACLLSWSASAQRSRSSSMSGGGALLEQALASYQSGAWSQAQALYDRYVASSRGVANRDGELLGRRLALVERLLQHEEELKPVDSLVVSLGEVALTLERILHRSGSNSVGTFRLEQRADSSLYFAYTTSDRRFRLESTSRPDSDVARRYDRVGGELVPREDPFPGLPASIAMPILHTDGIHLVFAQISDEGLGGYDLYLSRAHVDTGAYLRPTLLGLPYNSPANDYMLLYDEVSDRTILVTDRACADGQVMIVCYQGAPRFYRGVAS